MDYDVTIIGGGPGGYVCAIRCGQLGLQVALVEERDLGGVCLHWGCVPTKALYSATQLMHRAQAATEMGITFASPHIDRSALAMWKDRVVSTLTSGIESLLLQYGVTIQRARGRLDGTNRVALSSGGTITADRIVLATGSSPVEIPGFSFEATEIWSSDDALVLREIPDRLCIIGGGVIGLELATIYRRLGSTLTVIELLPEVLVSIGLDRRAISLLRRSLSQQGIEVLTGTHVESYERREGGVVLRTDSGDEIETDRILLAVGRRPNSADLGLETVDLEPDRRGFLRVNESLETTAAGIYAIGDLVPGPMLAHKASAEGVALADAFAGTPIGIDYDTIPQAVFTDPEIAAVGWSEKRAQEEQRDVIVGRCPYAVLGKALGMRERDGFFQVVAERHDHRIVGVQIVGAEASDLISEAAVAVRCGLTLEAISGTIHPHPTLPEGLKEAAENALGRAIHTGRR